MRYLGKFECRVCGAVERKPVISYGDSDCDGVFDLVSCQQCEGIKAASPKLWDRMKFLSDKNHECLERAKQIREGAYNLFITRERLTGALHQPFALDKLYDNYYQELEELLEIAKEEDGKSSEGGRKWAFKKALQRVLFDYFKLARINLEKIGTREELDEIFGKTN